MGLKSQGRPRGRGGAQASWTSAGMGLHREKGSTQGRDVKRRDTGMRWGWGVAQAADPQRRRLSPQSREELSSCSGC